MSAITKCIGPGCESHKLSARGMCAGHYYQWQHGRELTPIRPRLRSVAERDEMGRKRCQSCREWKGAEHYWASATSKDGLRGDCKPCSATRGRDTYQQAGRDKELRKRYKLTPERYAEMLDEQGGCCKTCGRDNPGKRLWHVDHDHKCCPGAKSCGKCIRGLLCGSCNLALGYIRDNPETLRRMLDYITLQNQR